MNFLKEFLWAFREPMSLVLLVGQCLFFSRFLVQWIASERRGESTVPVAFWFLSIAGSLLSLYYFIWRREPILILAQTVGMFVYCRNLVLIRRKHRRERTAA